MEWKAATSPSMPTGQVPSPSPATVLFETPVALDGGAERERLLLGRRRLAVVILGERPALRRVWRLNQIDEVRLEAAIGSCFVQARVGPRWHDVLRCPGGMDRPLIDLVARLQQVTRSAEPARRDAADSGQAATNFPSPGLSPVARRWSTARRLGELLRPFRGRVLLLLALSAGAVAIEVAPPMLQRMLVDDVLQAAPPAGRAGPLPLLLLAIVASLLMFRVAAAVLAVWKGWVSSQVGTTLTANLRDALVQKLNALPMSFHDRNQVGMLMSRVAYDTETLHTLVYHITSGFLLQSLQLLGIGIMLFYLNPKLAMVTLLPMPLILAASWYFTRYLNPRNNHYWEAVGKQATALMGMLSGIRIVKAFVQESREIERFSRSSRRLRDSRQTVDYSTSLFSAATGLLFATGVLAVWYIGGRDVLFGHMSLGSLVAFLAYLAMFYAPLTTIAEAATWFSSFFTAIRRIFHLLDTAGEPQRTTGMPAAGDLRGRVEFRGVSFGYAPHRPVLKELDFAIAPGQMIGVVGRSGSGKSTLVSLIGRLYPADAGQVLLDGVDVRAYDPRQLRQRIGMVPQEPFLFRGSIAENIRYGKPEATPEQLLLAARCADAHDFVLRKPLAYDTPLGEGGTGLSGGERQRLSIARALVYDPAILILDEATASVDAESERAICDAIRRFSRQRTTIVIAHRLSTLRDVDRLLVLDEGRLIEQGSPQELLARGGLYATLASLQWNVHQTHQRLRSLLDGPAPQAAETAIAQFGEPSGREMSAADGASCDAAMRPDLPCPNGDVPDAGLHWLTPEMATIEPDGPGLIRVTAGERTWKGGYVVRAFPATHQERFLAVRHRDTAGQDVEVGLLRAVDEWPPAAQRAMRRSLNRRYLLRQIREIRQVRTDGNRLTLAVWTDLGLARLHLEKTGEGAQEFGEHGLLLIDGQQNHYVVADRRALPKRQRRLLALYFGE